MRNPFPNAHPDCWPFIKVVEELLVKRRQELASGKRGHTIKQFTRDEFTDMGYSSYKKLLSGKVKNVPRRYVVMDIADYLETTSEELNRLLVAASYAPMPIASQGTVLQAALDIALSVVSYWPIPAFFMDYEWCIHGWNQSLMRLYDLSDRDIEAIPLHHRHVLHLIFDPKYAIYHRLHGSEETWEYTAKLNIFGFKSANLLCQNDGWYLQRVDDLKTLPEFERLWNEIEIDRPIKMDPIGGRPFPTYSTEITTHKRRVWVLGLFTNVGNMGPPYIVSYLPYREVDQHTFREIGIPTPTNGWGALKS